MGSCEIKTKGKAKLSKINNIANSNGSKQQEGSAKLEAKTNFSMDDSVNSPRDLASSANLVLGEDTSSYCLDDLGSTQEKKDEAVKRYGLELDPLNFLTDDSMLREHESEHNFSIVTKPQLFGPDLYITDHTIHRLMVSRYRTISDLSFNIEKLLSENNEIRLINDNNELEFLQSYKNMPNSSYDVGYRILKGDKFTFNNLVNLGKHFKDLGESFNHPAVTYNYLCTTILGSYALFHVGNFVNSKGQVLFDEIYKFHEFESLFISIAPYYSNSFGFCILKGLWHYMEGHDVLAMHYLRYSHYFHEYFISAFNEANYLGSYVKSEEFTTFIYQWAGVPLKRVNALYELSFDLYYECLKNYANPTNLIYDKNAVLLEYEEKVLPPLINCMKSSKKSQSYGSKINPEPKDPSALNALKAALNDWCSYFAYGAVLEFDALAHDSFNGVMTTGTLSKPLDIYIRPKSGSFDAYKYSLSLRSSLGLLKLLAAKFSAIINTSLGHNLHCHFDPKVFEDKQIHQGAKSQICSISASKFYDSMDMVHQVYSSSVLRYGYECFAQGLNARQHNGLSQYFTDAQMATMFKHILSDKTLSYQCSNANGMIGYEGELAPIEEALHKTHISVKEFSYLNALRLNRCLNHMNGQHLIEALNIEYLSSNLYLKENVQDTQPFKLNCVQRSGAGLFFLALHSNLIKTWEGKVANELIFKPLNELLQGTKEQGNDKKLSALSQKRHKNMQKLLTDDYLAKLEAKSELLKQEYGDMWAFSYGQIPHHDNTFVKEHFDLGFINGSHDQAASIIGISENSKDQLLCIDLLVFNYDDMVALVKSFLESCYQDLNLDIAFIQPFYIGAAPTFFIYQSSDLVPNNSSHTLINVSSSSSSHKLNEEQAQGKDEAQHTNPSATMSSSLEASKKASKSSTKLSLRTKSSSKAKESSPEPTKLNDYALPESSAPNKDNVLDDDFFKNFEPITTQDKSDEEEELITSSSDTNLETPNAFSFDLGAMLQEMSSNSQDEPKDKDD